VALEFSIIDHFNSFKISEAAFYWYGKNLPSKEPYSEETLSEEIKTKISQIERLLKETFSEKGKVGRKELRRFAEKIAKNKNDIPPFLYTPTEREYGGPLGLFIDRLNTYWDKKLDDGLTLWQWAYLLCMEEPPEAIDPPEPEAKFVLPHEYREDGPLIGPLTESDKWTRVHTMRIPVLTKLEKLGSYSTGSLIKSLAQEYELQLFKVKRKSLKQEIPHKVYDYLRVLHEAYLLNHAEEYKEIKKEIIDREITVLQSEWESAATHEENEEYLNALTQKKQLYLDRLKETPYSKFFTIDTIGRQKINKKEQRTLIKKPRENGAEMLLLFMTAKRRNKMITESNAQGQPQDDVNQLKTENKKLKAENENLKKDKIPFMDSTHKYKSEQLITANKAWEAMFIKGKYVKSLDTEKQIKDWLEEHHKKVENKIHIARIVNPKLKRPGKQRKK